MALVECKECEGKVSSEAALCPHCGFNLERFNKERAKIERMKIPPKNYNAKPMSDKVAAFWGWLAMVLAIVGYKAYKKSGNLFVVIFTLICVAVLACLGGGLVWIIDSRKKDK